MSNAGGRVIVSARVGIESGVRSLVETGQALEGAGFDQVWISNDVFGSSGLVGLPALAYGTDRIQVGSAVLEPVSLHPVQIAMFAAGMQELSDGRFLLGLGAGSNVFFRAAGIQAPGHLARTTQGVLAIRALLDGQSPADIEGIDDGWSTHARLQEPAPTPIYVGAMGPKMLALTGRLADGALALCLPPAHYHRVASQIDAGAREAGRTIDDFDLAACLWCSVDPDPELARQAMAAHIARYAGSLSKDALIANGQEPGEFDRVQQLVSEGREDDAVRAVSDRMLGLGIVGGPSDVVDQCLALIESGVRHISFGPPMGPDPRRALQAFRDEVLPVLHSA